MLSHRYRRLLTIAVTALLFGGLARSSRAESPTPAGLSISNEFIRIRVNPGPQEAGRFAVDTTGGDPSRSADDNKVLIYGSREPWTSFSTVLLDGAPFVFGGPTKRRAGANATLGTLVKAPELTGDKIRSGVRCGDLEVTQELGFARNPTTRVKDAARISYQITNRGDKPHLVGLRVVLDTMLGENDGAPLRAGDKAIDSAMQLAGGDLPDYWQAFDSLSQPAVIAQGTLRGSGLTPPDRLEMVDWGTLADSPWSFPFPTGAGFTRSGEQESDTAVALFWDPTPLKPGENRTYATLYGVGGVTLSPAQLSLGMSAPAEIDYQYEEQRAVPVIVYLENSGGFESRKTACTLQLPKGLKLAEGDARVELGNLKPGETKQLVWKVVPTGEAAGALVLVATAESENLEPNRIKRELIVNSPPQLALTLAGPKALAVSPENRYSPNPFEVKAMVRNQGAQVGRNLVVALSLPEGLKLEDETSATRVSERLAPNEAQSFSWQVRASGLPTGTLKVAARASAGGAKATDAAYLLDVPELTPELRLHPARQTIPATTDGNPTLLPISVKLAPARNFAGCRVSLKYDPAVLEPLYVSRGEAFVDSGRLLSPWSAGRVTDGQISEVGGQRLDAPALNSPEVTLFTAVFIVKAPGETKLSLEPISLTGADGKAIRHRIIEGYIKAITMEAPK